MLELETLVGETSEVSETSDMLGLRLELGRPSLVGNSEALSSVWGVSRYDLTPSEVRVEEEAPDGPSGLVGSELGGLAPISRTVPAGGAKRLSYAPASGGLVICCSESTEL